MRLVIDTNIIFSALIKDSITRRILLISKYDFFIPEYVFIEIQRHSNEIMKKSGYDQDDFDTMLDTLISNVNVIPTEEFKEYIPKAFKIMKDIDEDDTSFLALALMIKGDGIWSNDPHFDKQNDIKVWKTKDIVKIL
jgi:predicted nucleic acid-binding protein